jgi:SAM-dependent methyltransferase
MAIAPTARFSDRADDYAKYRPGYPPALLDFCRRELGLTPAWVVADIGSGTGILARMFLEQGHRVLGVEPNAAMRQAGERELAAFPGFTSVDGAAEATGLPGASVDLLTAATAFHWFDPARARAEALRILRPGGWALLVWNIRHSEASPFLLGYDALLAAHAIEYRGGSTQQRAESAALATFFGTTDYRRCTCPNAQTLDFEGLKGRILSSSYSPKPGHPQHAPLLAGLRTLFDAHRQQDGLVRMEYLTQIYAAPLRPPA